MSVEEALRRLIVDFLVKYVRPDKIDGIYLPEVSGQPPVFNWREEWEKEGKGQRIDNQ